jgi:hypothetical protein
VHRNWSPPYGGGTHSALPLPDRNLLIVADEAVADNEEDGRKHTWVFDIREPPIQCQLRHFRRHRRPTIEPKVRTSARITCMKTARALLCLPRSFSLHGKTQAYEYSIYRTPLVHGSLERWCPLRPQKSSIEGRGLVLLRVQMCLSMHRAWFMSRTTTEVYRLSSILADRGEAAVFALLQCATAGMQLSYVKRAVPHTLAYGPAVRFRLLPTPPPDDAVTFSYGAEGNCGRDFHPANGTPSRACTKPPAR